MKILILAIIAGLGACANHKSLHESYGSLCAEAGLTPGTTEFAQCLIYRYESDRNREQNARSISCKPNIFGGFDCD